MAGVIRGRSPLIFIEPTKVSVLQNGQVIQNNVQLPGVNRGALDNRVESPGPLLLQDHENSVVYRNIWAAHLPLEGSHTYEPR